MFKGTFWVPFTLIRCKGTDYILIVQLFVQKYLKEFVYLFRFEQMHRFFAIGSKCIFLQFEQLRA